MTGYEIAKGESKLTFDSIGAYVKSLSLSGTDILMSTPDGEQTHGGAALLIPYANRVRNATYYWNGRDYHLPKNNGDHSIHGLTRALNWDVQTEAQKAVLTTVIRNDGYPDGISVRLDMMVDTNSFWIHMNFKNSGKTSAPLSPGMHPYFRFLDSWKIRAYQEIKMLEYVDNYFPDGNMVSIDPAILSSESGRVFDNCFTMGNRVRLMLGDHSVDIETQNMPYFVIYNGRYSAGKSVAVEPMVGAPDAFNNHIGLVTLAPMQQFSCSAKFELVK
ncbi:MAG: aldose 1-epimerase [Thermoplasmataceae archaeon]